MTSTLTARELQRLPGLEDWRVLATAAHAWFDAASHADGARLLTAITENQACGVPAVDIRRTGVQVRLPFEEQRGGFVEADAIAARAVSAAARRIGLAPAPAALQEVQLTIDAAHVAVIRPFWEATLGYRARGEVDVEDPERRAPSIWFQQRDEDRPLRNRVHVDVVRDLSGDARAALLTHSGSEEFSGPFGVRIADREGNEVDVVPAAPDWQKQASDWRLLFAAMVCYPTASLAHAAELATAAASIADDAGLALAIDVRGDAVILDSGKDRWETDERPLDVAVRVQAVARELGLVADASRVRFVQLGIDAVDVAGVREFWRAALGYDEDPRAGVTDIHDRRRLSPTLFVQDLEPDDTERRAQRNRIHADLVVPDDQAQRRLDAATAAGGRLVSDAYAPFWWTVADPEGNELDISVMVGREEHWASQ